MPVMFMPQLARRYSMRLRVRLENDELFHEVTISEPFADQFQFPPPFRGGLGIRQLQFLERIRTIWEAINRAFSLSSAGTTCQGACGVLVALRQSS